MQPKWLTANDAAGDFVKEHFAQPGADAAVDKALRLDSTVMLVDDPVKRVDNMTMAWGGWKRARRFSTIAWWNCRRGCRANSNCRMAASKS